MAQDVTKHLEKAKRYLEKSKLRDAVAEYQAVLEQAPTHLEAVQALADIFSRLNEPARAAHFYGMQFDRLVEAGDTAKAAAIFTRFLKPLPQPAERLMRFAFLLQKQNKVPEAIEQYTSAAQMLRTKGATAEAVECLDRISQLDPENPARHIELAELAGEAGKNDSAARGYLRAGQLVLAAGELDRALELLGQAHSLAPEDRSTALLFATARLRKGDAPGAVALLEPFTPDPADTPFLSTFGEALLRSKQLDRARQVLEAYYRQKPDTFGGLFELVSSYFDAGEDEKAVSVLTQIREWMFPMRRESKFATQVDRLAAQHPASLPLAEFWAGLYEVLNREAKYFDALVRLFDLYFAAGRVRDACDSLDRLVDIDAYDYRNQERISRLEGKADPAYLRSIQARAALSAASVVRPESLREISGEYPSATMLPPTSEEARARQALEDLMVQVEIFLQYSLRPKAIERLQRISEIFPGEEENNERLRELHDRADWWPQGAPPKPKPASAGKEAPPTAGYSAETHRDLAAIAEITRLLYRQTTPREVLAAAVNEIGKYMGVARCLAAMGPVGDSSHMAVEYARAGLGPAESKAGAATLERLALAKPDSLGAVHMLAAEAPVLADLGLSTALGVQLTDKEAQSEAGVLLVGDATERAWKPNESFFLQAVGDQLVISVNHTRLRSLVRTLAVADEKTGLLSRGAYLDCLLAEISRAGAQSSPVALVLLQVDRGREVLRQHGEAELEKYLQQVALAVEPMIRQSDLAIKYTAWSLAFLLPDTGLENARALAEKLRATASGVASPWNDGAPTLSAVVTEAAVRPGDEREDVVTEWINRAEFGLDETRQKGGNTILVLAAPAR
jgi:diguanylate cyclase (GGDEF)-like protein